MGGQMGLESINGQMAGSTKVDFMKVSKTVMGFGERECTKISNSTLLMKAVINKTKRKDTESSNGRVGTCIQAIIKTTNEAGKE
jgi:hypothetical protein